MEPSFSALKIRHLPVKRVFDLFFSLMALSFGLPFFLLIAVMIKCSSKGKIIYSQTRVGRGGKTFHCYKFRTMYQDADFRLQTLLKQNPSARKEWGKTRKLKNDPRITRLGKFLRRTSLDELPQFYNVLKGDLSIVGPRPVVPEEINRFFGVKAHKVLSVRPGLTGIWQVSGRNNTSYSHRVHLDETYVDTRSLWLDLKLICKTVPCMIFAKGAY
ncbi:Exopolysaccharide production protein ExoY [Waddlia chondrophila 2032/99]|uniref:Galactosyl-1-phosphate transferase n=2 Tax=Waddlia chondrophila TaxID=71667 RepID=D6YWL6_WADCW|nr:sugar transferase [Waddlia chondrophila]ADI38527.1 galactosyl-1-phosphate transferase [Waddlia chondrophila WSU 86-1044]CCB91610.1 Exopolysaccharide production protein ExoY [Waddlia chondrophila 2032/99]